ncbi:MAG: diguanylate cyclase response regulator [Gammaproteobacteria bacterium]|nr:MAG: diguanylate cyclase response regulator [Gammaproteobacteria bacterium]
MKVLLAEDSRTNQILIRAYIEKAGHEIEIVNNGQEAIDQFHLERPDLILMDIVMPVKDGIEAAREIRAICEQDEDWIPIIFLSAMTKSKDIEKAIDAGGDDYLTKPVESVVLNAKLRAMQRLVNMREQLQKANYDLRMMTVKDGLTGIANRRYFDEVLAKEIKRAGRTEKPLSLVMCDIDFFKPYNDNYGHQAGDSCLKYVAITMAKVSKRPGDLVARYGGEEFGIILPETDNDGALAIAESIRTAINKLNLSHGYSAVADHITISSGVATIQLDNDGDDKIVASKLIKAADKALYKAKDLGRNQIVLDSTLH